jgi:hypothetical protein
MHNSTNQVRVVIPTLSSFVAFVLLVPLVAMSLPKGVLDQSVGRSSSPLRLSMMAWHAAS